jgi:hypothetical protein
MGQDHDKSQSEGRRENAAEPPPAAQGDNAGAARYPAVNQDEAVERTGRAGQVTGETRSFGDGTNATGNPQPPQGAGDGNVPPAANEGRLGPGGDPAEGKR